MIDARRGTIRSAVIVDGILEAAMFVSSEPGLPPRDWIAAQLGISAAGSVELLAGRPAKPLADRGPIICVCFDIGLTTILDAIRNNALTSVEAVGAALNAGTNCGSCQPAIAKLFDQQKEIAHG